MKFNLTFSKYLQRLCKAEASSHLRERSYSEWFIFKKVQRTFAALVCLGFASVNTPAISWSSENKQLLAKGSATFWASSRLDMDKKKVFGFCTLESVLRQQLRRDNLGKALLKCYEELDKAAINAKAFQNWHLFIDLTNEMITLKQHALKDEIKKPSYAGVGIILASDEKTHELAVQGVVKGSPAEKAEIRAKDVISEIEGKSANGMSIQQAVQLIRGKEGSTLSIRMRRDKKYSQLTLRRRMIAPALSNNLSQYWTEYESLLEAYFMIKDFKNAGKIIARLEKLASDEGVERSLLLAEILVKKSYLLLMSNRSREAIAPISRAINIYEGQSVHQDQRLLYLYNSAVLIKKEAGDYLASMITLDRALSLYDKNDTSMDIGNIKFLISNLSGTSSICPYLKLSIDRCFGYSDKAYALATKYLSQADTNYLLVLGAYADSLREHGRIQDSIKIRKQLVNLLKKYDPSNTEMISVQLDYLSSILAIEEPWQAEQYALEAYDIVQRAYGQETPKTIEQLIKLSSFYQSINLPQKAYEVARQAYVASAKIKEKSEDADEVHIHASQKLVQILSSTPNRYQEILPISRQLSTLVDKYSGRNDVSLAVLPTLAQSALAASNYSEAAVLTTRYLGFLEELLKKSKPVKGFESAPLISKAKILSAISNGQEGLASIYAVNQNYPQAERFAFQSINTIRRPEVNGSLAELLLPSKISKLAFYQVAQGKLADAGHTVSWLLTSSKDKKPIGDLEENVHLIFGLIAFLQKNPVAAASSFDRYVSIASAKNYSRLWQTPSLLRNQLASSPKDEFYTLYQDFGNDKRYHQVALKSRLNFQGVAAEVERLQSKLLSMDNQNKIIYERLLSDTLKSTSINLSTADRKELNASMASLQEKLIASLPGLGGQVVSVGSVAKALPKDGVLIEYQKYVSYPRVDRVYPLGKLNQRYLALILDSSGNVSRFDLGPATDIDKVVHDSMKATSTGSSDAREKLNKLTGLILSPLKNELRNKKEVFLSADSELNLVPFGAIPSPFGNDLLFAEAVRLRVLTTGRDLIRLQQPPISTKKSLVFSNPNYKAGYKASVNPNSLINTLSFQRSSAFRANHWNQLPGTEYEGQQVASLLGAEPISGDQATPTRLLQSKAPLVLHVATHGFFASDQENESNDPLRSLGATGSQLRRFKGEDSLLHSGLVLAGANHPTADPNDDGYLTSAEATKLQLDGTELVVLSACDTGRGDIRSGEGVYGLQRALTVAGARSTLLSLWKVDDAATAEFMTRFYKRLKAGEGRSEALALTQAEFRSGEVRDPQNKLDWKHPYYWAAWQLVGDWRPIKGL